MSEQPPNTKKLNSINMNNNPNGKNRSSSGGVGPRRRIPSAEELIKHYESQGIDTNQASVKVINDLQKALFRLVTTKDNNKPQHNHHHHQQMDVINSRLLNIDMKLDMKPGYPHMLGLGVASAAAFQGLETWIVRSTTNSK